MISASTFKLLNSRFKSYLLSLKIPDQFVKEHVDFKVVHTYHVVSNIMTLARSAGLSESDTGLAKIIALFHDVGRFEQFIHYGTFDDKVSVNHAELGIKIVQESGLLNGEADPDERELIVKAVMNHNIHRLNPDQDERILLFSRLIRDADKLDIWEIMTSKDVVFRFLDEEKTDGYDIPDVIYESFKSGRTVPGHCAHIMNDYRLLRLGWIYDMNFPGTFQLIIKRGYIPKILERIPPSGRKDEIANIINQYVQQQAIM